MTSSDLQSYQLQLQQVQAALTSDPDNAELVKLQQDLEQVIQLTMDLISAQGDGDAPAQADADEDAEADDAADDAPSTSSSSSAAVDESAPVKHWQVGEQCQALCAQDGLYHEADITSITPQGEVAAAFLHNGQTTRTRLGLLRFSKLGVTGSSASANKKEELQKQREYLKRRKAKKAERFKNMEKEREKEQHKWKSFSTKAFGKKGFVKKSIFKTPENAGGRVGVGTCGVSGQKMTQFSAATKYNKRN